jgi:hypothetical protein
MNEDLRGGLSEDPRHELLDAVAASTLSEDYFAVVGIANSTNLFQAFEIVEFLDVKERHCQDPQEQGKWRGALTHYLGSLTHQEFPESEAAIITDVVRRLQFEAMLENDGLALTEEELDIELSETEAYSWDADEFHVRLDPDVIERVRATPIFQTVERFTRRTVNGNGLADGHWIIMKNLQGSRRQEMLAVFDELVFKDVNRYVSDQYVDLAKYRGAEIPKSIIDKYASSRAVALEMKRAVDKYIFRGAERALKRDKPAWQDSSSVDAAYIIGIGASTFARCEAMMDKLGLELRLLPSQVRLPTEKK